MKFDTETAALLDCEIAYKKLLEGIEFRANDLNLKTASSDLLISPWSGLSISGETAVVPLK